MATEAFAHEHQVTKVGGTTDLIVDDSAAPASESTGPTADVTLPIAAAAGGLLLALAGGGLYLRRRLVG